MYVHVSVHTVRSQLDTDDEVRDRATFYLNILLERQKALNSAYILNGTRTLLLMSTVNNHNETVTVISGIACFAQHTRRILFVGSCVFILCTLF